MRTTTHTTTLATVATAALATAAVTTLAAADTPQSPNIVYLLVDDMGFADLGFNGSKEFRTPNIDALARSGLIFQNYYVQPLCSATRCTLLTGRMPNRHGIYGALKTESRYGLPPDERILPQLLKTAGYTTAITGKWHCGEYKPEYRPMHRGWDHQYGLWYGQIDYFTHERGGRVDWYRNDKPLQEKGYSTHLIGQEAIRLIKAQPNDKPLFLYVPFNAVHGPFQAPTEYEKPFASLKPTRRTSAAMLAVVDEVVGKIHAALVDTGKAGNTIIIFSSDNGGVSPGVRADNTPLRDGKGSIYEGGVRSAAFAVWPGKIAPGSTAAPVHLVDWYPTLAALTGADLAPQKKKLDGQNILPLLLEGKAPDRDALLIVGTGGQRYALRMGDWKLLVNPKGPPAPGRRVDPDDEDDTEVITNTHLELYNLATDISEKHNLAASEPDRVKTMHARLQSMMRDAVPNLAAATTPAPKAKNKSKKK